MKRKPETKEIYTKKIEVQNECQNNNSVNTTSEEMSEMAKLYKYIQQVFTFNLCFTGFSQNFDFILINQ